MSLSLNLDCLKDVPCPKGDDCSMIGCLFQHNHEVGALSQAASNKASTSTAAEKDGGGSPPRKRVKTDDDYDPASPAVPKDLPIIAPSRTEGPQTKAEPAKRPISPPPLKRKHGSSPAPAAKTAPLPSIKTPIRKEAAKGPIPKHLPAAKKVARAPEELNPRHLDSAPAPHATRYQLVKLLHAEQTRLNGLLAKSGEANDKKLLLNKQQLIWRVLDEEEKFATTKGPIYTDSMKHYVVAHKKMPLTQWRKQRTDEKAKQDAKAERAVAHAAHQGKGLVSDSPMAASPAPRSLNGPPTDLDIDLPTSLQVQLLRDRLITPISDLTGHGYVPTVPTPAEVADASAGLEAAKGWEECDRCRTRFQVFPGRREDGVLCAGGKCKHHPGKRYWPPRAPGVDFGANIQRFKCCNEAVGDSTGCEVADTHVFKVSSAKRLAALWNFEETPENEAAAGRDVVCFDCEMGYTSHGMEVIRLTATSWPDSGIILDVLVRPIGEILDLNSRYSGVWPEDMVNAQVHSANGPAGPGLRIVSSPQAARALLFSYISPKTILIGHGLENDLNSMRIVHPTLIDTILLYPHPKGLPIRYGLRVLTEQHLNRRIQVEVVPAAEKQGVEGGGKQEKGRPQGHDSAEDAIAAGDLVRIRLKKEWENMKLGGWAARDRVLVPPGSKQAAGLDY